MATQKLKFLVPRGYGGIFIAAGTVAEIPEPWASHFLKQGSAELAEPAPKEEKQKAEAKPTKAKPKSKK